MKPLAALLAAQRGGQAQRGGHPDSVAREAAERKPARSSSERKHDIPERDAVLKGILTTGQTASDCSKPPVVHLTDALYNPPTPVKRLFEALHRGDLADGKPRETTPRVRRRMKRFSPADVDQLVSDYCDGQGSIYELADRWGVHRNTIAKHLKSRGLELGRLSLTSEEIRQAQGLRDSGLSFNAIGRNLGRDPKTVKTALS